MAQKNKLFLLAATIIVASILSSSLMPSEAEWGFFGHRRINRMAVFTLPPEMMVFFRPNIEYITDHAVDPDKRRYATKHEAVRHYIDIDHWGVFPFDNVPRDYNTAVMRFGEIVIAKTNGDTLHFKVDSLIKSKSAPDMIRFEEYPNMPLVSTSLSGYRSFWYNNVMKGYFEEDWSISCDSISLFFGIPANECVSAEAVDHFTEYGIVPYHLLEMQKKLTEAFTQKDKARILRTCAEIGHYIGDAHVPLHTTENYNGAFTNQDGIHAFWESRLPELFADKDYDFFVGKARYIDNPKKFYWDAVLDSHALLDSVLAIEKHLSLTYPTDQQYCFEDRLGRSIRTQCTEYATTYHQALDGMVEKRMRDAILAIGNSWYTAWVDAGQPDMTNLLNDKLSEEEQKEQEELERNFNSGELKGRQHGN